MKPEIPSICFETTALCNLNCRYCYNHWKCEGQSVPDDGGYKQSSRTLKKIFKMADVKHITFSGGEPMIAERFSELVLMARMKGAAVTVISNGIHADFSAYKQLVDLGVSLFELPIHSSKLEIHDYLTQHEGSHQKSISTIRRLLKLNAEVVAVVVLTKANCKDIDKTLHFIHSLGIQRVMINRVNIGGEVTLQFENLLMSREEMQRAFQMAATIAPELGMTITSNVCTPICVLNPKDFRGIRFSSCSFDISKRPVTLDYRGDVRFCNHSPIVIGNIFENDWAEISQSEKVQQWAKTVPSFCADCRAYDKCKAGCRAASEQLGLSLEHPDPIMEQVELDWDLLKRLKSGLMC
ncbi:MAG: radical SAM protein [Mangrovibacterium sp.]